MKRRIPTRRDKTAKMKAANTGSFCSKVSEDSVFDEMREDAMNDREQQISELEHKLMAPKDWQFKGEVSARQRPLNSLVEQDLDFQVNRQRIQQALPEQTH